MSAPPPPPVLRWGYDYVYVRGLSWVAVLTSYIWYTHSPYGS